MVNNTLVERTDEEKDEGLEVIEVPTAGANVGDSIDVSGENSGHGFINSEGESMEVGEGNGDGSNNTQSIDIKEDTLYKSGENYDYEVEEKKVDTSDDLKVKKRKRMQVMI
jgi:hypothetical protein